ncbi:MAG: zinc ribbon domain-containing protein [Promethearchaeota archaeon]
MSLFIDKKTCPKCGTEVSEDQVICVNCGVQIKVLKIVREKSNWVKYFYVIMIIFFIAMFIILILPGFFA